MNEMSDSIYRPIIGFDAPGDVVDVRYVAQLRNQRARQMRLWSRIQAKFRTVRFSEVVDELSEFYVFSL